MNKELKALLEKLIDERVSMRIKDINSQACTVAFEALTPEQVRLLTGPKGDDGKDFDINSSSGVISAVVENYLHKNRVDFTYKPTTEELASFKGKDGNDGTSVDMVAIETMVSNLVNSRIDSLVLERALDIKNMVAEVVMKDRDNYKIKFSDLSDEEIETLRGPPGNQGDPGQNFIAENNFELLSTLVKSHLLNNRRLFALSVKDLTSDELAMLQGPAGKDFNFSENEDHVRNIVADNISALRDDFRLKFSDLTPEEKNELRVKFEDLTEDQLKAIAERAGRGQRGKDAYQVATEFGFKGSRIDWLMSIKGADAPQIKSAELKRLSDTGYVYLALTMSDGQVIETNSVKGL